MAHNSPHNRNYFIRRMSQMQLERQSFIPHYRDLSEFIQPRRGRFLVTDRNKGARRHQSIINSRATRAHRIARSGMFAGIMSPGRPWFKLESPDQSLMRFGPVKDWLYQVELQLRKVFDQSNLYNMAPVLLGELLLFGTGAIAQVDDEEHVARFYTYPAGSYLISQNDRNKVDTFVREFQMTTGQIVDQFGINKVSTEIRDAWDRGFFDGWWGVVQFIEPNPDFRPGALGSRFKRFLSTYFEHTATGFDQTTSGVTGGEGTDREFKILQRGGFDDFPIYVPRWEVTGQDIYGTNCPAMEALGDIKGLQIMERRKGQAVDKLVNPPLSGPPSLKTVPVSSLPGGVTIYDAEPGNNILRATYQIDPRIGELRLDIQSIEQRINEAFFVDMFLAISAMPGIQPKNQLELSQRNQERLLQLGPTLEQVHGEFLTPLIDRTFNQLVRRGLLPQPPVELEGANLQVRFVSVLALAQRAVEIGTIEQFSQFVGAIGGVNPEALDKYNSDEAVEQYGQLTGVIPTLINDAAQVGAIRQQRAEAQQAQMAIQLAQQAGQGQLAGAQTRKAEAEAGKTTAEAEQAL